MEDNSSEKVVDSIAKDFKVVGTRHVHTWYAWATIGVVFGLALGMIYVANTMGRFDESEAARGQVCPFVAQPFVAEKKFTATGEGISYFSMSDFVKGSEYDWEKLLGQIMLEALLFKKTQAFGPRYSNTAGICQREVEKAKADVYQRLSKARTLCSAIPLCFPRPIANLTSSCTSEITSITVTDANGGMFGLEDGTDAPSFDLRLHTLETVEDASNTASIDPDNIRSLRYKILSKYPNIQKIKVTVNFMASGMVSGLQYCFVANQGVPTSNPITPSGNNTTMVPSPIKGGSNNQVEFGEDLPEEAAPANPPSYSEGISPEGTVNSLKP